MFYNKKEEIFIKISNILNLIYPPVCGICGKLNQNYLCSKCRKVLESQAEFKIIEFNKNFEKLLYIFKYEGTIREIILQYKFREKSYIYESIVNFLLKNQKFFEFIKKYDKIVPVPISKERYKQRGYNQSFLIAKSIAKNTNLQLEDKCLFKTKNIIEQSKLSKEERIKNIQGVYELKNKEQISNKNIILFDDIYTTGSTANECCKILRKANPKSIAVFTIAKD